MSNTKIHSYKSTFILDLRDTEDDVEKVIADLTEVLAAIDSTVTDKEDRGTRDFARAADSRFSSGRYVEIYFDGPSGAPASLREKLRLDKRINRVFTETA